MKLDFFCLQPIKITDSSFLELINRRYKPRPDRWFDINENRSHPELNKLPSRWAGALLHGAKHNQCIYDTDYHQFNTHLSILIEEEIFDDQLQVNINDSGFIFFYDNDYKIFNILICLSFDVRSDIALNKLTCMYKTVRDLLVIDIANGNDEICRWASDIRSFCEETLTQELPKSEPEIVQNTGYICSIFSDFNNIISADSDDSFDSYQSEFLQSNHSIDLISEKKSTYENLAIHVDSKRGNQYPTDTNETTLRDSRSILFLGWRFSTIYGLDEETSYKLLPIFIKLQNLYFQVATFYKPYISKLYDHVMYDDDYVALSESLGLFDKLILSFRNLVLEQQKFLSTLKPYQAELYSAIESYWGLQRDYGNINSTLSLCQSSLQRKLDIKNNQVQQKQSDILFVLATIQIFSIIGILSDYLSLKQINSLSPHFEFSKSDVVLYLVFLSVFLIIYAYTEKVWFTVKRLSKSLIKLFE